MCRCVTERESCNSHISTNLCPYLSVLIVEEIVRYREEVSAPDFFPLLCFLPIVVYPIQRPLCLKHQGFILSGKNQGFINRVLTTQGDIAPGSRANSYGLHCSQINNPLIFPVSALKIDQKLQGKHMIIGFLILHFN